MTSPEKIEKNEVLIHYLKTNNYKTVFVDGAYGGITPKGLLHMDLYLERHPIPKTSKIKIDDSGNLLDEEVQEKKQGIVREVQCGLAMDINTAISIRDWINTKLEQYEKLFKKNSKK